MSQRYGFGCLLAALVLAAGGADSAAEERAGADGAPDIALFFEAAGRDEKAARRALDRLGPAWQDSYTGIVLDLAVLLRPAGDAAVGGSGGERSGGDSFIPGSGSLPSVVSSGPDVRARLFKFLQKQTGQRLGDEIKDWQRWLWRQPYDPHPEYATFKGAILGRIDPRMRYFFPPAVSARIRLDEIVWGGTAVNGIPPLDHPAVVPASEAGWLKDKHVVFGVALNGEARAYPQRILAWHELARDRVGGVELTLVYCTLCGAVIPYRNEVAGRAVTFGTSGLLYRSNKLMFDEESMSLWSTLTGRPLVGHMAQFDLRLEKLPVVTTTWGEWKALHPETTVLSLETGHERDYGEGAAYRDYFRNDRLWFEVPQSDDRLRNKDEVLALLVDAGDGSAEPTPLAVAAAFLAGHPVYHVVVGERRLVIVTSAAGANRVYDAGEVRFVARPPEDDRLEDTTGRRWRITEAALLAEGGAARCARVPAHRTFWFGWFAQFPETALIR